MPISYYYSIIVCHFNQSFNSYHVAVMCSDFTFWAFTIKGVWHHGVIKLLPKYSYFKELPKQVNVAVDYPPLLTSHINH